MALRPWRCAAALCLLLLAAEREAAAYPTLQEACGEVPPLVTAQGQIPFEQTLKLALTRNERARLSELNVVQAEAAVDKARSGFLPTVVASGTYTQRGYDIVSASKPTTPPTPTVYTVTTPYNSATSSLVVNQPLINVPAWPLYRQAQRLFDAQEAQTIDDKRVLTFDAAKAFFATLSADALVAAAQSRWDLAQKNCVDSWTRAKDGLTTTNDLRVRRSTSLPRRTST